MTTTEAEAPSGQVAALVVATAPDAGSQTADLLWRPVLGRPLVAWALRELSHLASLSACALAAPTSCSEIGQQVLREELPSQATRCLPFGEVSWGYALSDWFQRERMGADWYIVIDASLPLVTADSLRAGLLAAARTGVAIAGEPIKETLKRVDGSAVAGTLPRERLRRLLSPLIFSHDALGGVFGALRDHPSTSADLVGVAQMAGVPLTTFDAGYPCVRVTSEHDLAIVESLLRQRELESSSQ